MLKTVMHTLKLDQDKNWHVRIAICCPCINQADKVESGQNPRINGATIGDGITQSTRHKQGICYFLGNGIQDNNSQPSE